VAADGVPADAQRARDRDVRLPGRQQREHLGLAARDRQRAGERRGQRRPLAPVGEDQEVLLARGHEADAQRRRAARAHERTRGDRAALPLAPRGDLVRQRARRARDVEPAPQAVARPRAGGGDPAAAVDQQRAVAAGLQPALQQLDAAGEAGALLDPLMRRAQVRRHLVQQLPVAWRELRARPVQGHARHAIRRPADLDAQLLGGAHPPVEVVVDLAAQPRPAVGEVRERRDAREGPADVPRDHRMPVPVPGEVAGEAQVVHRLVVVDVGAHGHVPAAVLRAPHLGGQDPVGADQRGQRAGRGAQLRAGLTAGERARDLQHRQEVGPAEVGRPAHGRSF
jgi:hypothetical protein